MACSDRNEPPCQPTHGLGAQPWDGAPTSRVPRETATRSRIPTRPRPPEPGRHRRRSRRHEVVAFLGLADDADDGRHLGKHQAAATGVGINGELYSGPDPVHDVASLGLEACRRHVPLSRSTPTASRPHLATSPRRSAGCIRDAAIMTLVEDMSTAGGPVPRRQVSPRLYRETTLCRARDYAEVVGPPNSKARRLVGIIAHCGER